jgi:hypothetical protein
MSESIVVAIITAAGTILAATINALSQKKTKRGR